LISTLNYTQPIQFIIIDGQATRKLNLSIPDMHYFLITLSAIISLFIQVGLIIESAQEVRQDTRIIELHILLRILFWISQELFTKALSR
jgi:hypothetical protein